VSATASAAPAEPLVFDDRQLIVHPPLSLCASRRRATMLDCLDSYENVTRYRARFMSDAQADAIWSAVWQLRTDVVAALERCEAAEREARWCRDE
jgi:hypothetical protein